MIVLVILYSKLSLKKKKISITKLRLGSFAHFYMFLIFFLRDLLELA